MKNVSLFRYMYVCPFWRNSTNSSRVPYRTVPDVTWYARLRGTDVWNRQRYVRYRTVPLNGKDTVTAVPYRTGTVPYRTLTVPCRAVFSRSIVAKRPLSKSLDVITHKLQAKEYLRSWRRNVLSLRRRRLSGRLQGLAWIAMSSPSCSWAVLRMATNAVL